MQLPLIVSEKCFTPVGHLIPCSKQMIDIGVGIYIDNSEALSHKSNSSDIDEIKDSHARFAPVL